MELREKKVTETAEPLTAEPLTEGAPTEAPPTERAPTEALPTERAPTEALPTEAPPTEGPPTEGPPTEGPQTEGAKTERAPTEGPPTEGPPTEGPPTEGAKTERAPTEGPPTAGAPTGKKIGKNAASKEPYLLTAHSIDELLSIVGEYGKFQKLLNLVFCIGILPSTFPLVITLFTTNNPTWRCVANSSHCPYRNTTFPSNNDIRCHIPRADWTFTEASDYSLVTQYDLVCGRKYLVDLITSMLFVGFMVGAVVLGWFADIFGRRTLHFVSICAVTLLNFVSIFITNVHLLIATRFFVGVCLHGTFPQVNIMLSEIVGSKNRALCNATTIVAVGVALPLLALKAYFLHRWKELFIACSLPYLCLLIPYSSLVTESVRYLRVKGRYDEAMAVFRKIAEINEQNLPQNVTITPVTIDTRKIQNTNPLEIFRSGKMAARTAVLSFSAMAISMANYCLLFATGNISGHLYRDFAIMNIVRIPVCLITPLLINKFGRKKITRLYVLVGSIACVALAFTPKSGDFKYLRVVFAMFGVSSVSGVGLVRQVWELELYPTHLRGEGTGFGQLLSKIGAISAVWIINDLSKLYAGGAFILIGALNVVSVCLQTILPETKAILLADTQVELENGIMGNDDFGEQADREKGNGASVHAYTNEMYEVTEAQKHAY